MKTKDNLRDFALLTERRIACKILEVLWEASDIAGVAQLVEQLTCNQQVVRSNRIAGSMHYSATWWNGRVVNGNRL